MFNRVLMRVAAAVLCAGAVNLIPVNFVAAQFNHRYAKLSDFNHHIYLEQHELPVLGHGPTDPAPAPDGQHLAFAARGWLWLLDLETGDATRLTSAAGMDSRPRWSPDGKRLAFVRDNGRDTAIVILKLDSRIEKIIDSPTIELDPEFSADGASLYYSSGTGGFMSLWRRHLESDVDERLTDLPQVERNTRRLPGAAGILYLHGDGPHRVLRARDFVAGTDTLIHGETLTYHLTADVHPGQRVIVYSAPIDNAYHLWTLDLDDPRVKHRLTTGDTYAMTPAFSADGNHIYFVDLDEARQFRLMRLPAHGGAAQEVTIRRWDQAEEIGTLSVAVTDASGEPVTARVSITRDDGHPVAFHRDATYFDPQTGRHYFYLENEASFSLPAGRYTIRATRGPMTPMFESTVQVRRGPTAAVNATLTPVWEAAGYASADYHVHLNGDGHHRAQHDDALRAMAGEDLDLLAPMSWNRWERRIDAPLVGLETVKDGHIVAQGQEVRSHFHGHIGLTGVRQPFAPWFWGPRNPTLGDPDRTNGDVLTFAEATGAFPTYVHPISEDADPFENLDQNPIPLELVTDAVLAERLGLEIVCAWTSPLGNAHLWYRLLNIGQPVAAMSGTDGWIDFHRTPAVGTGRNYVRVRGEEFTAAAVLEAAIAGRGFVTTGPALIFEIGEGVRPGDVVPAGRHPWRATLAGTSDVQRFELVINGVVVERFDGIDGGSVREYKGEIDLPEGGWIAARALAAEPVEDAWPTMHARPFAHTSPIWIEKVGSTEPEARRRAAGDLIRAIDAAEVEAREAYGEVATPRMQARFDKARAALQAMVK